MRYLTYLSAALFSCHLFAGSTNSPNIDECIIEGSHVQLMGKLVSVTFPGQPNYESIEKGDKPEVYWVLNTLKPYCGEGYDLKTKTLSRLGESCSRFQLMLKPEQYDSQRALLGKKVIVSGEIVLAKTGHQHTSMLIDVNDIELESAQ
ncbi:hypothetical protein BN59_02514 [Legionella massiliensis]|uniref:DUF4431 domain-containing protein n=1 Tax=Legionella massiliensis TaxID=1034943 RepID=A0A078KZ41_9GAMM|nr:DUF4431 domain-containing protein [Legionella massiliensis]CDZ78206.1 hypothetical protein BN59_02514 [Legionella massiliensis]CEE13944.1 hypothetical protein BN1094_02514 [Legionella massiliensis]